MEIKFKSKNNYCDSSENIIIEKGKKYSIEKKINFICIYNNKKRLINCEKDKINEILLNEIETLYKSLYIN